jgi:hypothetical protein
MKLSNLKNTILYAAAVGVGIMLLGVVIVTTWIGYEVKNNCQAAERAYGGECVAALITTLQDDHQGWRTRNDAIWALGQLGDVRALPALQNLYTGNIPNREPLDQMISQYELRKAINLVQGGANPLAIFWRLGFLGSLKK